MYLLHGKLTAKDGQAGRLADILLKASKLRQSDADYMLLVKMKMIQIQFT
jgi:hypothetical protein